MSRGKRRPVIRLDGVRQNNLKNLAVEIPVGSLVAVTGVSGSGKSSFAFDTLYAEGQRRYVESFSTYARQFLDRMDKPRVDAVEGIPPAIAINQSNPIKNSRSTVGTMTEICDYQKILFAKRAVLHCRECDSRVEPDSPDEIARQLRAYDGEKAMVSFPLAIPDGIPPREISDQLRASGFHRWLDRGGGVHEVGSEALPQPKVDVIVDRLKLAPKEKPRLVDAIEQAFRYGKGRASAWVARHSGGFHEERFSDRRHCARCDLDYPAPVENLFSFNSPIGACSACKGFGRTIGIDEDLVVPDQRRTLSDGAVKPWQTKTYREGQDDLMAFCRRRRIPVDIPFRDLKPGHRDLVFHGDDSFYGVYGFFEWLEGRTYRMHIRVLLSKYRSYRRCEDCDGTRFSQGARLYRLQGRTLAEIYAVDIETALELFRSIPRRDADPMIGMLIEEIEARLDYLVKVGLGYLTLDRQSRTLSGGEMQRVDLTTALGSSLVGALYVLDEPSMGLHPKDTARLMDILKRLRDSDNTVVVVEHDPDVIRRSDLVLDLGPGAGDAGGEIVYYGPTSKLSRARTSLTASYMSGKRSIPIRPERRPVHPERTIQIRSARANNLKAINVSIPLGLITAVTGVSGSGKSSLIDTVLAESYRLYRGGGRHDDEACDGIEGFEHIDDLVVVDQSPIGRTPKANPATYTKAYDGIRRLFAATDDARQKGFTPSTFSFNVEGGRCELCRGDGFERIEMQFLADVYVTCESCAGSRFTRDVLEIRYRGHTIEDVLAMTIDEALELFSNRPKIVAPLRHVVGVGLGYLRLGQPVNTLSGGEAQRLKLGARMAEAKHANTLFVFDEPTTGLHLEDIRVLLGVLQDLVDGGASVVVIEHNVDVIKNADWVIDLGPEGGSDGGSLVVTGTPETIAQTKASATGAALRPALDDAATPLPPAPLRRIQSVGNDIVVRGAREHNLKSLDVDVPRDRIVVITGLSGSGKSSLAFDIIYASGQRRFLESLSAYARQYIHVLDKPEVDLVRGMPPAIAIEQRLTRGGGSSTVATVTEIYHYLRLMFSKLGTQYCVDCDIPITPQTEDQIAADIERRFKAREISILVPLVRARKGSHRELIVRARQRGYQRLRIDGELVDSTSAGPLERYDEHDIEAVLATGAAVELGGALREGLRLGKGTVIVTAGPESRYYNQHRACPRCDESYEELDPRGFSFNSRYGWCEACAGSGESVGFDTRLLVPDSAKSLSQGAVAAVPSTGPLKKKLPAARVAAVARRAGIDPAPTFGRQARKKRERFFDSLIEWLDTVYDEATGELQEHLARFRHRASCPACEGARIHARARAVRIGRFQLHQLTRMTPGKLMEVVAVLRASELRQGERAELAATPILDEIDQRLGLLLRVGLSYLSLDRRADTLSGGEAQRVRLAAQLGTQLRGVCYVLDEPTIGLHPRDNRRLLDALGDLRAGGNSVLIVEHDEETIRSADHVIDLGPGGGTEGGRIVAQGTPAQLAAHPDSATGRALERPQVQPHPRPLTDVSALVIRGARAHNLKGIDASFPVGRLTVVTGVSGSGKSTLVRGILEKAVRRALGGAAIAGAHEALEGIDAIDRVLEVDQTPIGKAPRSIPASYVGFLGEIRRLFSATLDARVRGYAPGRFSFNVTGGRCEACKGQGTIKMEMSFLPNVHVHCECCQGRRYDDETLAIRYGGKNIHDVLEMTCAEAESFFAAIPTIHRPVKLLNQVGLSYLRLGQPSNTLSGGEAQRIKLAFELSKRSAGKTLYLLDEPTTGLHMFDIERLMTVLHAIVDAGNTVVVVEHNLDVIARADCVIDLGPEGGDAGGELLFRGPPAELVAVSGSHTGRYLRDRLSADQTKAARSG